MQKSLHAPTSMALAHHDDHVERYKRAGAATMIEAGIGRRNQKRCVEGGRHHGLVERRRDRILRGIVADICWLLLLGIDEPLPPALRTARWQGPTTAHSIIG